MKANTIGIINNTRARVPPPQTVEVPCPVIIPTPTPDGAVPQLFPNWRQRALCGGISVSIVVCALIIGVWYAYETN
jgi:hypothetical protein